MSYNQSKISRTIYAHEPVNPPNIGRGLDAKITLLNSKHLSIENWQKGEQPSFEFIITDPKEIGLASLEDNDVEDFVDDVILSCNLALKQIAFSKIKSNTDHSIVNVEKKPTPKPKVKNTPTGIEVTITSALSISSRIHNIATVSDELNEKNVLELLTKILSVKNNTAQTKLKITQIQKSLEDYSAAMNTFVRYGIFKHLSPHWS